MSQPGLVYPSNLQPYCIQDQTFPLKMQLIAERGFEAKSGAHLTSVANTFGYEVSKIVSCLTSLMYAQGQFLEPTRKMLTPENR